MATEQYERYKPVNPLPEEISSLPSDETVCTFCGVSYLIHNEIKKLEDEVERIKAKLVNYDEMKSRYSELECRNSELSDAAVGFKSRLSDQETVIGQLTDKFKEKSKICDAVKGEYSKLNSSWEEQALILKERTERCKKFEVAAKMYPSLLKQLEIIKNQKADCVLEIANLKSEFGKNMRELNQFIHQLTDRSKSAELELEVLSKENMSYRLQSGKLSEANKELSDQFVVMKNKLSGLEKSSDTLNHAQKQNVQLSKIVSETQAEVESLNKSLLAAHEDTNDFKRSSDLKSQENTELKLRINDLTRRHTSQIEDLNKKYQSSLQVQLSLKNKINSHVDSMVKNKEQTTSQTQSLESENGALKSELVKLTKDLQIIEKRTRDMSESHRMQLSDLHVSYQEQLKAALDESRSYKSEIDKLEAMKSNHEAEVRAALKTLQTKNDNRVKDVELMYKQSQIDLEKQIDSLSTQYSKDLKAKDQAIKELEKSFNFQAETVNSEKVSLSRSIEQLNVQIGEYETTIKLLECRPPPKVDESATLKKIKSRNSELESEVLSLQRIVQKECEERMELTDCVDRLKGQVCDREVRETSEISATHSVKSSSSQSLLNSRSKIEKRVNSNNRNSKPKKPQPKNYSNWIKK